MDVQPDQVAHVLIDANIEPWVLMGLHGYVGYLGDPRATQDVDVMVSYEVKDKAREAIQRRSSYRAVDRKGQDAVDFRLLVKCNREAIDMAALKVLANAVWDGGGNEIEEFLTIVDRGESLEL